MTDYDQGFYFEFVLGNISCVEFQKGKFGFLKEVNCLKTSRKKRLFEFKQIKVKFVKSNRIGIELKASK